MKKLGLAGFAAIALALGFIFMRRHQDSSLVDSAKTGDGNLDRFAELVVSALDDESAANVDTVRACMAIIRNESGGRSPPVIGDATLGGGPSVGPMQIYRSTAKDLGLWTPPPEVEGDIDAERASYAELANDETWCVRAGCKVFVTKLQIAGGNVPDAIRRYNGGGPAAAAYRDRAVAFMTATWGSAETLSS